MVAYRKLIHPQDARGPPQGAVARIAAWPDARRNSIAQARALAAAEAMTPPVRARLRAQLTERLKTGVDAPSWGPDWVRHGDRHAPKYRSARPGLLARLRRKDERTRRRPPLAPEQLDEAHEIARNLEKSRQVHHYRWLYALGAVLALSIALAGDVRRLSDHPRRCLDARALERIHGRAGRAAKLGHVQEPAGAVRRADRALHAEDHRRLWPQHADHDGLPDGHRHDRQSWLPRRLQQYGGRDLGDL